MPSRFPAFASLLSAALVIAVFARSQTTAAPPRFLLNNLSSE
jgi:hypothetical protein